MKDSWSLLATPITMYDAAGAGMVGEDAARIAGGSEGRARWAERG